MIPRYIAEYKAIMKLITPESGRNVGINICDLCRYTLKADHCVYPCDKCHRIVADKLRKEVKEEDCPELNMIELIGLYETNYGKYFDEYLGCLDKYAGNAESLAQFRVYLAEQKVNVPGVNEREILNWLIEREEG